MPDSINVSALTIAHLFRGPRFDITEYQREYVWTGREVRALLADLERRFAVHWRRDHGLDKVAEYPPYYLGSIVYYDQNRGSTRFRFLVDGQQRVTTLHLLLLHLKNMLEASGLSDDAATLNDLTFVANGRTFTIHVPERHNLLEAIREGRDYDLPEDASPSLHQLLACYDDMRTDFPPRLGGPALQSFVHWLLNRVWVAGVRATDSAHAWEIFETVNDRGVRLDPGDLIKSALVGKATKVRQRDFNEEWRDLMSRLARIHKNAPADFFKDLFVARYIDVADEVRTASPVAVPGWLQQHATDLGLHKPEHFADFVGGTILPLGRRYLALRTAAAAYDAGRAWTHPVFFNEYNRIPGHLTAVLAVLEPNDSNADFEEKARLVAGVLDLQVAQLFANRKNFDPRRLGDDILKLIPDLRKSRKLADLRRLLDTRVRKSRFTFDGITTENYALLRSQDNKREVRYMLSRITAFVEDACGKPDYTGEYVEGAGRFDIEHIVPNDFARFSTIEPLVSHNEFAALRNRFGALLLIEKALNSSLGSLEYSAKTEFYRAQNLLAASLHPKSRDHNPKLTRFIRRHKLEQLWLAHPQTFGKAAIAQRQALYQRLCELVCDPTRLGLSALPAGAARP